MTDAVVVEPDLEFKQKILGLDAHDLTLCYQCGTCSVVCPLSTSDNPFPRKEMVWVQWGLKDRALANSSLWLCHQCGTCTAYCPRDAKPADVMAALRDYSITHYAVPGLMGRALGDPKALPLLFAIPVVIFGAILAWLGHLTALPTGPIVFSKFMPIIAIEAVFVLAMTLAGLGGLAGGVRYWRAMRLHMGGNGLGPARALPATLGAILRHRRFRECEAEAPGVRKTFKGHLYLTHLAAFYGFMGLVVTTTSVGIGIYAFGYLTPWPLWHPVKILGNVSGLALIAALAVFGYRRIADRERAGKSTYSDWLFLDVLLLTTLTGFLSQIFRLAALPRVAYPVYFVHLVFIFFLLVYIPYSKFAHLVYRTVAMLYQATRGAGAATAAGR
jgi:quinone-modifying oxidoreductase subunit QmoC